MGKQANTIAAPVVDNLRVLDESIRRRTIAVISHPDAGKLTLTEALLLHAHAISKAGAVHGKSRRHSTVSDWMPMEQARGISITGYPFDCDTPLGIIRDSAWRAMAGPGTAGPGPGLERGPRTPGGLIALGWGLATSCR